MFIKLEAILFYYFFCQHNAIKVYCFYKLYFLTFLHFLHNNLQITHTIPNFFLHKIITTLNFVLILSYYTHCAFFTPAALIITMHFVQIEAADKKYRATCQFLEEQASEREQERDEAQKQIAQLREQLREREKDRASCERVNSEVCTGFFFVVVVCWLFVCVCVCVFLCGAEGRFVGKRGRLEGFLVLIGFVAPSRNP